MFHNLLPHFEGFLLGLKVRYFSNHVLLLREIIFLFIKEQFSHGKIRLHLNERCRIWIGSFLLISAPFALHHFNGGARVAASPLYCGLEVHIVEELALWEIARGDVTEGFAPIVQQYILHCLVEDTLSKCIIQIAQLILDLQSFHPSTGLKLRLDHSYYLSSISVLHVLFNALNERPVREYHYTEANQVGN